jgi:hypothetical protein
VFGTFDDICAIVRRDAAAYGIALDAHGKIAWGRSDIGGDPIVVVLTEPSVRPAKPRVGTGPRSAL